MSGLVRLLLVEDNTVYADVVREVLSQEDDLHVVVVHVAWLRDAVERLEESAFDLVLLDLVLPDSSGIDTLKGVRAVAPDVPVIVMTGHDDAHFVEQAMEHGAKGFLQKGHGEFDALAETIRRVLD